MSLLAYLHRITDRRNLSAQEAREAMTVVLNGEASTAQIAAFAAALRVKGETADELVGFALAMREKAMPLGLEPGAEPLVDTCGTGGDGLGSFNVSTIAAFVVAAAGVRVAKHGNRSISSKCGSADLLEGLGLNLAAEPVRMGRAIGEIGIGFLFAPLIHPAMKHAQAARLELRMRTAFNLLGPLTNPAGATAQLVGAPSPSTAELIAEALARLGLERGLVVHGSDGMDEITTTGETLALEISRGAIAHHTLNPADFGVPRALAADLRGGNREENCRIAEAVLGGQPGPHRDIVLVNAAAALVVAGQCRGFSEAMRAAARAIDTGAARAKLDQLVTFARAVAA